MQLKTTIMSGSPMDKKLVSHFAAIHPLGSSDRRSYGLPGCPNHRYSLFFDGRSKIVGHLSAQRAAFGGLIGLASGAVELLEHQVTIVRRILRDPIERYLLAHEVGLGKTIEAGILIRQHTLTNLAMQKYWSLPPSIWFLSGRMNSEQNSFCPVRQVLRLFRTPHFSIASWSSSSGRC